MLQVEQLSAGYGKVQVLHSISLQVPDGKLVTLIGANGAGKTTTLRALSGMIQPTAGRILLAAPSTISPISHDAILYIASYPYWMRARGIFHD